MAACSCSPSETLVEGTGILQLLLVIFPASLTSLPLSCGGVGSQLKGSVRSELSDLALSVPIDVTMAGTPADQS